MESRRPANVRDVMRSSSVSESATPRQILAEMDRASVDELPVAGEGARFRAMVERRAVERRLYDRGDTEATAAMLGEEAVERARPDEPIEDALNRMLAADLGVLPVVSADGRLQGLLALADLERVPNLVEGVGESRRQRALADGAGVAKVNVACGLASAALGAVLFALWVGGYAYGLPRWVSWVYALAAALAVVGAAAASSREMISIPMWAVGGVGLCFTAGVGHSLGGGIWTTWVPLGLGLAFLVIASVSGTTLSRRRHLRPALRAT
jgi:CBS-domain-containing membrane protein